MGIVIRANYKIMRGRNGDKRTSIVHLETKRKTDQKRRVTQVRNEIILSLRCSFERLLHRFTFTISLLYTIIYNTCTVRFCREAFFDEKTGHAKKAGEIYKFPKLAEIMRIIAKEGTDAIYNGSLTSKLVDDLRKKNGIITEEDLANYE